MPTIEKEIGHKEKEEGLHEQLRNLVVVKQNQQPTAELTKEEQALIQKIKPTLEKIFNQAFSNEAQQSPNNLSYHLMQALKNAKKLNE